MTALLVMATVAALGAAASAWRSGRSRQVIAGCGAVAVASSIGAWTLAPGEAEDGAGTAQSWIADSALAFSRAEMMPAAMPRAAGGSSPAVAGSLPELAERLAARLAQSPEDAAGWSLLAATYRQLGRQAEAEVAAQRAVDAGGNPEAWAEMHRVGMGATGLPPLLAAAPAPTSPGAQFVMEGQRLRVQRRFPEAAEAYRKAVEADPGDADAWADLADCQAAAAGKDLSAGREALERALAIDPRHRKALWLQASLELQQRRYAQAAATWKTLATLVAEGSPDARVIAANIAEAEQLAGRAGRES